MADPESQERHLLFALLAFQNDFINHEQLLQAFSAWVAQKSTSLDKVLVQQGAISDEDRILFDRLVGKHLERFGGDAAQSLANLSGASSVREELARIAAEDEDVLNTITLVPGPPATEFATIVSDGPASSSRSTPNRPKSNRFRILRQHARGGLGVVFLAQDEDLSREVAMKQIRLDRADEEGYRVKFLQEAEVTGQLEHPGIVPVYALGVDANGRPFYAMRFIRGEDLQSRIRAFHRARKTESTRLDGPELRGLLRRFVDVCNAIQYAHDRGVLHRDLKPGNVMLGKHGETLVVDWGLAKPFEDSEQEDLTATVGPHLTPASFRTASASGSETKEGTFIGTPAYAPPEQVLGELNKLGPRSDVYSLGAILYELLTGKVPVSGTTVAEVITKATKGDFPSPRSVDADIPRALEAICRKAMTVAMEQRYASAETLRKDVENWLDDSPVTAYREPLPARLHRVVRKNPVAASWIAAVVLMGLLGAVGFAVISSGYNRELEARNVRISTEKAAAELARDQERQAKDAANLSRQEAEQAREAEEAAKETALVARNQAVNVRDFLVDIFQQPDPSRDGRKVTVFDSMVAGIERVRRDFSEDPATSIALLTAIYQSLTGLGLYKDAQELIQEVLEIRKQNGLDTGRGAIENRNDLGKNFKLLGKYADSLQIHQDLLEECVDQFGTSHPLTLQVRHDLANSYRAAGRLQDALGMNRAVYSDRREALGRLDPDTLSSQNTLANSLQAVGERQESLELRRENFETRKIVLGNLHPDTLSSQNNLAVLLLEEGQFQEALDRQTEAYASRQDVLGLDHPDTLSSLHNLANILLDLERYDKAQLMYREAVQGLGKQLSPQHPSTLAALSGLGRILASMGQTREALAVFEAVYADQSRILGEGHSHTLATLNNLAAANDSLGDAQRAIELLEQGVEVAAQELGGEHEATLDLQLTLTAAYSNAGQFEEMDRLCRELAPLSVRILGATHPISLKAQNNLAEDFYVTGEYAEAFAAYQQLQAAQRLALGENDPQTLRAELAGSQTAMILSSLKRDLTQLENGLESARKILDKSRIIAETEPELLMDALDNVGQFCLALERYAEAKDLFNEQVQLRVEHSGWRDSSTVLAGVNLVTACEMLADWQRSEAVSTRFLRELKGSDDYRLANYDFAFRLGYAFSKQSLSDAKAEALMKNSLSGLEALADPPQLPYLSADDMRLRLQHFLLDQGREAEAASFAPLREEPLQID